MRGVVAKVTVLVPGSAPGASRSGAPFEMATRSAGTVADRSKRALKAGSSKQGKARRASVASNCVKA